MGSTTRKTLTLRDVALNVPLNQNTATEWFTRVEVLCEHYNCSSALTDATADDQAQKDAKLVIFFNLSGEQLQMARHVRDPDDSSKAATVNVLWDTLKSEFSQGTRALQLQLYSEVSNLTVASGEELSTFLDRVSVLRTKLQREGIFNERDFKLQFLHSLSQHSKFHAWSYSLKDDISLTEMLAQLRVKFYHDLNKPIHGSKMTQSGAYMADTGRHCTYCNRPGHTILYCRDLRRDLKAKDSAATEKEEIKERSNGNPRGRGRGRGRGKGRFSASNASAQELT